MLKRHKQRATLYRIFESLAIGRRFLPDDLDHTHVAFLNTTQDFIEKAMTTIETVPMRDVGIATSDLQAACKIVKLKGMAASEFAWDHLMKVRGPAHCVGQSLLECRD